MKDAKIHIGLSQRLHDAIQAEAKKNDVPMSAYIRAVLTYHIFSEQTPKILGEEWIVNSKDGEIVLEV